MSKNEIKEVLIITSESFPFGMAGTNRIISLCKGFMANGLTAEVLSFFKYGETSDRTINPADGFYDGIKFANVFKSTIKNRFKVVRVFHEYYKSLLVFAYCLRFLNNYVFVIYYSSKTWPAIFTKVVCHLRGAIFFKEETEHPLIRTNGSDRYVNRMYLKYHYNIFDGLQVITQSLYNYFIDELKYRKPMCIVPMIVDIGRFINTGSQYNSSIVFSGVLDDQKEGVNLLIQAFAGVVQKYPGHTLDLYGKAPDASGEISYRKLIADLHLESKVIMHGYRNRDEMTQIFEEAKMFVLSRPNSLQATYGFSTKLGEYLATGRPVIATRVGEITMYLTDRKNVFLCEPDINSIMDKICEVIEDYEFALTVGAEGKKSVFDSFNNIAVTKRLIQQIQNTKD